MEFTSFVGSQHTIEPIGYDQVRKKIRTDVPIVVRSIREQFLIHSFASDFQSPHIIIPSPIRIESPKSYVMDMVYNFLPLDMCRYKDFPELFEELIRFKNYMYIRGYFAAGFTILHHPEQPHVYILVDFSQFGTIDSNFVMFPKIKIKYTILEAETSFGLIGRDIVTQSFKHKHTQAKSPQIVPMHAPEIQLCILDFPELNLDVVMDDHDDMDDEADKITMQRTESMFEIKELKENVNEEEAITWNKIDAFLTHVYS
jgi:hypothetical protein